MDSETNNHKVIRDSNYALYSQLEDIILDQIENGMVSPGQAIPSERELSRIYGMSRMTVRHALDRLVADGFLMRVSGKGTYVSEPKMSFRALTLKGLREQVYQMGKDFTSNLLDCETILASGSVARNLKIDRGTPTYKIERIFMADDMPVSMHKSYIPTDLAPGLMDIDLADESLYAILKDKYGLNLHHASETLETTLSTPSEALILGVTQDTPMILLRITMFNTNNQPVEYVKVLFRGDKVQLSLVI